MFHARQSAASYPYAARVSAIARPHRWEAPWPTESLALRAPRDANAEATGARAHDLGPQGGTTWASSHPEHPVSSALLREDLNLQPLARPPERLPRLSRAVAQVSAVAPT
jgi:hypothetical protein